MAVRPFSMPARSPLMSRAMPARPIHDALALQFADRCWITAGRPERRSWADARQSDQGFIDVPSPLAASNLYSAPKRQWLQDRPRHVGQRRIAALETATQRRKIAPAMPMMLGGSDWRICPRKDATARRQHPLPRDAYCRAFRPSTKSRTSRRPARSVHPENCGFPRTE